MSNLKDSQSLRGVWYPRKAITVLSILKLILGGGLVILGALALYQKASYARLASGLWAGFILFLSGVFGIFSVKMSASKPYVWAFFATCSMSIIATVLVIIYSATGLARDAGLPGGFVRDPESGELVPVTEADFPPREGAMFINLGLIILGVLDIFCTLPCCIFCLRELCDCYNGVSGGSSLGLLDHPGPHHHGGHHHGGHDDQSEWFMPYMNPAQMGQNIYFSQASGLPMPYKYSAPPPYPTILSVPQSTPPFMIYPPEASTGPSPSGRRSRSQSGHRTTQDSSGSEKRTRSKSPRSTEGPRSTRGVPQHQQQYLVPAPLELYYPYVPPPMPSYGGMPPPPYPAWGNPMDYEAYYNPQFYYYNDMLYAQPPNNQRGRRSTSSRASKRPRSKSRGAPGGPPAETPNSEMRSRPKKKTKKGPSDSDIEKTYTGLDRELAEEFIESTMADPAVMERTVMSGTESEAW